MTKSSSSSQPVALQAKLKEWVSLFALKLKNNNSTAEIERIRETIDEYDRLVGQFKHAKLCDCRMLEIGFGARPLRLIYLLSLGCDAIGVDLDQPVLKGDLQEFSKMYATNGPERTIKSAVRHLLFDSSERKQLEQELVSRGSRMKMPPERFIVMDSSSSAFRDLLGPASMDLIVSEDVFEHIPPESLKDLTANMRYWLKPDGLALIRPNIFTGITGGHLIEWYPQAVNDGKAKPTAPWDHIRENVGQANTYMNKLWRKDYRQIFGEHFEILDEIVAWPDLGRQFFNSEIARELSAYSEEELFSNNVMFVLKPRA